VTVLGARCSARARPIAARVHHRPPGACLGHDHDPEPAARPVALTYMLLEPGERQLALDAVDISATSIVMSTASTSRSDTSADSSSPSSKTTRASTGLGSSPPYRTGPDGLRAPSRCSQNVATILRPPRERGCERDAESRESGRRASNPRPSAWEAGGWRGRFRFAQALLPRSGTSV
jgi:hypothetical protein